MGKWYGRRLILSVQAIVYYTSGIPRCSIPEELLALPARASGGTRRWGSSGRADASAQGGRHFLPAAATYKTRRRWARCRPQKRGACARLVRHQQAAGEHHRAAWCTSSTRCRVSGSSGGGSGTGKWLAAEGNGACNSVARARACADTRCRTVFKLRRAGRHMACAHRLQRR